MGQGIEDEFVSFAESINENGNRVVEVSGFGVTDTLHDVTSIVARAGDGNDSLVIYGELSVPVHFHGGTGDDELVGGSAGDKLQGGGGNDLIQGGGGDDVIAGGSGDDVIDGGSGDDDISGGDRNDYLVGGEGNDRIEGGHGSDIIFGGRGMDTIFGGDHVDEIYGEEGTDIIDAGPADDRVEGGPGDDSIEGNDGDDTLLGNSGDDFVHGGRGDDDISGHAGDDILYGGFGSDDIEGGSGSDVAFGGNETVSEGHDDSADRIRGGSDNDFLIGDDGEILDFDGTFYIINVLGGAGDDLLEGDDGDDWAHGVGGLDRIFGSTGNDHLIGGDDADEIFGQDGSDWLEGGDGDDLLEGHAGGDLIGGGRGADVIDGGADEDQLYSHETGGAEPWHVSHVETVDDASADLIFGRSGPDEIVGGDGDDRIDAGTGSDAILGGPGDDFVLAGLGDDYIDVSLGRDTVTGQWGNDEFVIGTVPFTQVDGQHGGQPIAANRIPNRATNKLTIGRDAVSLDLADPTIAGRLSDVDRIDASRVKAFSISLDPKSVAQITDESRTLRLDIDASADARLDGNWVEESSETIDGNVYRRLKSGDVTLLVSDLKPRQRATDFHDVNGDGIITPLDALMVINRLNREPELPPVLSPRDDEPKLDVSGDNRVSPLDAPSCHQRTGATVVEPIHRRRQSR